MKKNIFALLGALALVISLIPCTYADNFNYPAFVGKYLSAGATTSNYAELNILSCTENSITVDFKFIKNDNQQLIYSFTEGTVDGDKATVPFSVSYADGKFVTNGTMDVTLTDWSVEISCDSPRQHLFDGTMKPQFVLNPHGTGSGNILDDPSVNTSTDVSVVLNGEKITFPQGISPIIINESTYVPLRSVFDKMGINVYWDQYKKNDILDAQSITCTKNNIIVQFTRTFNSTGSNVWTLTKWVDRNTDSNEFTRINITDLQPTIIGESSYIPLRVVSEAFDAEVGWIDETRVVDITCDVTNTYKYDTELIGKIEDYTQEMASACITEDFRSVEPYLTPYFSPQAKFYKYSAYDNWGPVNLYIFYGGFVEVYPVTADNAEDISVSTDIPVATETPSTDITTEIPTPVEETSMPTGDISLIEPSVDNEL